MKQRPAMVAVTLVAVMVLAIACLSSYAHAGSFSGQTLRIQTWPTGPEAEAVKKHIIDPFMKETGANVVVEFGYTAQSIAKVRAQKDDPQLDVILLDDIGVFTLAREGLLEKLDLARLPRAREIYPRYIIADSMGIGITNFIMTILYNPNVLSAPPGSWNDLWNPAYKGKIIVPPAHVGRALVLSVMAAMLNGGGLDNLAPAWPKLRQLKPNVHSFLENRALSAEVIKAGEAVMTVDLIPFWKSFIERGYPIAIPSNLKEGYFSDTGCVALVKGSKGNRDLAYKFIDRALAAEAQKGFAEDSWFGPTNRNVTVPPLAAKYMIVTPEDHAKATPIDKLKLLESRPMIVDEYNKIFAR